MKKVGLATCYFKNNYGSKLQAYATQKVLENNNIPCEHIDIKYLDDFKKGKSKYYRSQIFNFKFIFSKIGMLLLKIKRKLIKNELSKNLNIRDKEFNSFDKYFSLSKRYTSYSQLSEECYDRYSDVIVGSDQLWLPVNVVADYYTLNFVPDNVNKISYSTSLGISYIPKKYKKLYNYFLSRINSLSVREDNAVELIKRNFGLDAKCVCDPTMLLSKEEWLNNIDIERKYDDKYIFCYFLGRNKIHRKFVERLAAEKGLKIVSINHCDEYDKYSDIFADYIPYDVNPFDWINLIYNAEYVCTDSFHGSVFSIILNKKFFTFSRFSDKHKMSTNSRIISLLKKYKLECRLISGEESINQIDTDIEYEIINLKLSNYREESKKFLFEAITYKKEKKVTVDDLMKYDCCGCSACEQKCPTKAIDMLEDSEGFLYPFVNEDKCIKCGICIKTCRSINPVEEKNKKQWGFIVQHKDEQILRESTSGGAFTAFAAQIINEGGVVFGAALVDKKVTHTSVDNINELYKFRGSKYAQSEIKDSFKQVQNLLNKDIKVLFSGTACQIEGLLSFLGKEYDNLYLIDVVCRSVPSPLVLKKYMQYKESEYGEDLTIKFRDKKFYGYNYSNLSLSKGADVKYHAGSSEDEFLKLFLKGYINRPCCSCCKFKKQYRESDATIWDCYDVINYNNQFDNNKGCTRVLIHSEKGRVLFENSKLTFNYFEVNPEKLINNSLELISSSPDHKERSSFMKDISSDKNFDIIIKKYIPKKVENKLIHSIKVILIKLGIHSKLRVIINKIRKY